MSAAKIAETTLLAIQSSEKNASVITGGAAVPLQAGQARSLNLSRSHSFRSFR